MLVLPTITGTSRLRLASPLAVFAGLSKWAGIVLGPPVLAILLYYGPAISGGLTQLPARGDAHFYIYQLARAAELNGQWWNVAVDEQIGFPYPTMTAKHPGIYEGVDLMMIAAITGRWLSPVVNYHAMIVLILSANGWAAIWFVRRLGGGWLTAAVAVLLLTANLSTAGRLNGHLHLFKHCWTLLAVAGFLSFLRRPTGTNSALLGGAAALVVQGSFYAGYFVVVSFTAMFVILAIVGQLRWNHFKQGVLAAAVMAVFTAVFTFPVWSKGRAADSESVYFHRDRSDLWHLASEMWQYLIPPGTNYSIEMLRGAQHDAITLVGPLEASPLMDRPLRVHLTRNGLGWEGWHYPGAAVLITVAGFVVWRLHGRRFGEATWWIDRAMLLAGVCVLLSLAGGPGAFLFDLVSCFRAYGRAGIVAVAIVCAVAPLVAQHLWAALRTRANTWVAFAALALMLLLTGRDALQARRAFMNQPMRAVPGWVTWLKDQPADVKLAAFGGWFDASDDWHWRSLHYRLIHNHATLNGAENALLDRDLEQLNAMTCWMNPDGLWFVLMLGYDTLAFDDRFLELHPWIESLPWLQESASAGEWRMFRYKPDW